MASLPTLFPPELPEGFQYDPAFIDSDEERGLAEAIAGVEFSIFTMYGVAARRRVAFFGEAYDQREAKPLPPFLLPLRARAAGWARVDAESFVMALINEYRPGATIGWHRDAPQYGIIAGISLLSSCRIKLRPYVSPRNVRASNRPPRRATHELELAPGSGYLIEGVARSAYEHSIPATSALRYSVTFRTQRK